MNVKTALLFFLSALSGSYSLLPSKFYYEPGTTMTWTLAQTYCKKKYTDLAVVNSKEDLDKMSAIYATATFSLSPWWIGGFNLISDSQNITTNDNSIHEGTNCPAIDTHSWKEKNDNCLSSHPFYCSQDEGKRVFMRLKLKPKGQVDLTDPVIRESILDEINEKFNKTALGNAVKIQWTTSLDHSAKNKGQNSTCN